MVFFRGYKFVPRGNFIRTASVKHAACVALFVGILAQSGGFFLHMMLGQPKRASAGTNVTIAGAALLACAVIVLVYGLITTH